MTMNRREFVAASVAGAAMLQQGMIALAAPAANLQVTVDATKVGEPVNPLLFGGYMEPATTRVWAEMLTDRKFLRPITDTTPPPQRGGGGGRFRWGALGSLSARQLLWRWTKSIPLSANRARALSWT